MEIFCFGIFAKKIKDSIFYTNEETVNILIGSITEPLNLLNKNGERIYYDKKEVSNLLNCKLPIPKVIQMSSDSAIIKNSIIKYFQNKIVDELNEFKIPNLINELSNLINYSDFLPEAMKNNLLTLANKKTLDEFLATTFLYTLNCPNDFNKGKPNAKDVPLEVINIVTETRPLNPSDYFRGRDTKLEEIKGRLTGNAKLLILNGMGGIGKTEICRKLFHEAINGKLAEVKKVGWLTYSISLEQTMFGQFLEIQDPAKKMSDYLLQARKYINSIGGALLLFIDNANKMTEKESAWLLQLGCKIVLTSRRRNIERLQAIEIGKLELTDCRILYRQHYGLIPFSRETDSIYGIDYKEDDSFDEDLDAIITMADRHTLAVELLAKTQKVAMYSTKQFRKILEEQKFSLNEISERIPYVHNPENGNWDQAEQVFIEQLSKVLDITGISGEKLRIMRLFSLLAPEAVPSENIKKWFNISDFEGVNNLVSAGWLTSGLIGQEACPGLVMHPLISSVVQHKAMPDEETARPLISGLTNSLVLPNDELFSIKMPFIKHAISVIDIINGVGGEYPDLINHASKILLRASDYQKAEMILYKAQAVLSDSSSKAATTHNNLGMAYQIKGKYTEALNEYEKACNIFIETVGKEHCDTATAYNNIASIYSTLGKYKESLEYFTIATKIREQIFGKEHSIVQETYNNMAVVYAQLGDTRNALHLLFLSLKASKKQLKPEHPFIAVIYDNISQICSKKSNYKLALKWECKAKNIFEYIVGEENPDTANCYNQLGLIWANKGKYDKAFMYHEKALTIYKKLFGDEHLHTAQSYNNIGQVYFLKEDYHNALQFTKKSLNIMQQIFGKKHLNTVYIYINLANIYSQIGEYKKAIALNNKVLEVYENIISKFHPDLAMTYNSLSQIYNRIGNYDKAMETSKKALSIIKNSIGLKHEIASTAYNNIGNTYQYLGEYNEAYRYYELALNTNIKIFGKEHPNTAGDYDSLGEIYSHFADYQSALDLYICSMNIKEKILGTEHPETALSYSNIAGIYDILGNYDVAEDWYLKALNIRENIFGREHPKTAFTLNSLAGIYSSKGDYKKALKEYEEVLRIREKIYGKNNINTAIVCNNIAYTYTMIGEFDNAIKWHKRTLEIKENTIGKEHLSTAISYINIASIYFDKGEYIKAKEYYLKALVIRKKKLGKSHPDSAAIYHALACIYYKVDKDSEALNLFFKAYLIRSKKLGTNHKDTLDTYHCLKITYEKNIHNDIPFEKWLNENINYNNLPDINESDL